MKEMMHLLILTFGLFSCSSGDQTEDNGYVFITKYSTSVGVSGAVGQSEPTFKI
jgi:hypothetical protein